MKGRNSKVVPGMEEKTEKHKLLGFILCPVLVGVFGCILAYLMKEDVMVCDIYVGVSLILSIMTVDNEHTSKEALKKDKSPSEFLEDFQDSYCHNLTEEEIKNGQVAKCNQCGFETPNGVCRIKSFVVKDRKNKEE